jgi:hypothetical protein
MARRRRTIGLDEAMNDVVRKADPSGKRHGAQAVAAWHQVVGDDIARHTRGFALREKRELVVFVDSAAWANQLSLMSTELVDRLNAHLGRSEIRILRFTVSRKVSDEMKWSAQEDATDEFYAPDLTEPVPLTEREREQALHIAGSVRDPELRELALRVMIKDLERKKGARERAAQEGHSAPSDGS